MGIVLIILNKSSMKYLAGTYNFKPYAIASVGLKSHKKRWLE